MGAPDLREFDRSTGSLPRTAIEGEVGGAPWATYSPAAAGLHLLAVASKSLVEPVDYESTLTTIAGMALPHLGSWCIVDVVGEDESMRRLAVLHPDPEKQEHARRLQAGWPPTRDDPLGLPLAARSRSIEVLTSVPDELLVAAARSEENLRDLRALSIGSIIVVPLLARDRVLGAITFVSANDGHQYTHADVELAEELASRCAMALDNARLLRNVDEARSRAAQLNERLVLAVLRQQELADEARNANRAKSHFLATMSHEVRTPISAIVAYADILDLEIAGPINEKQRAYLARLKDSSRHLVALVDDVLDFAKVEAGRVVVKREPNSAEAAIEAALTLVERQAASAGVEVQGTAGSTDNLYLGDGRRVQQILVILLTNALNFTDRGGTIAVSCGTSCMPDARAALEGAGPWTFIAVTDNGSGVSEEDQKSMFKPFVQVGAASARPFGGSGLGLAIALDLANRMNGDLTVRSALGEGSCFTLWLPCPSALGSATRDDP
ncbi:MAG: GAF domain-containing protein [Gemmatimonadetes bacterium]|nr:GAF domain-containing protein [Gemmatimonadota bacterium]